MDLLNVGPARAHESRVAEDGGSANESFQDHDTMSQGKTTAHMDRPQGKDGTVHHSSATVPLTIDALKALKSDSGFPLNFWLLGWDDGRFYKINFGALPNIPPSINSLTRTSASSRLASSTCDNVATCDEVTDITYHSDVETEVAENVCNCRDSSLQSDANPLQAIGDEVEPSVKQDGIQDSKEEDRRRKLISMLRLADAILLRLRDLARGGLSNRHVGEIIAAFQNLRIRHGPMAPNQMPAQGQPHSRAPFRNGFDQGQSSDNSFSNPNGNTGDFSYQEFAGRQQDQPQIAVQSQNRSRRGKALRCLHHFGPDLLGNTCTCTFEYPTQLG